VTRPTSVAKSARNSSKVTHDMPRRRSLQGVLGSFLETVTSRHSDYDGYWIFGLLVDDLREDVALDLLRAGDEESGSKPLLAFFQIARERFRQQMVKGGLPLSYAREARLRVAKSPAQTHVMVGPFLAAYEMTLTALAISDLGARFEKTRAIHVARHDPDLARRSLRGAVPSST
jgi:hypothetical protein